MLIEVWKRQLGWQTRETRVIAMWNKIGIVGKPNVMDIYIASCIYYIAVK